MTQPLRQSAASVSAGIIVRMRLQAGYRMLSRA